MWTSQGTSMSDDEQFTILPNRAVLQAQMDHFVEKRICGSDPVISIQVFSTITTSHKWTLWVRELSVLTFDRSDICSFFKVVKNELISILSPTNPCSIKNGARYVILNSLSYPVFNVAGWWMVRPTLQICSCTDYELLVLGTMQIINSEACHPEQVNETIHRLESVSWGASWLRQEYQTWQNTACKARGNIPDVATRRGFLVRKDRKLVIFCNIEYMDASIE